MIKSGWQTEASAPVINGRQYFRGCMDYQQMAMVVDLLRNEKPLQFGWLSESPNQFHLMTGSEPVGEGDGLLANP